jgi:hypothetical protein
MIDVVNVELNEYMPHDVAEREIRPTPSDCQSSDSVNTAR